MEENGKGRGREWVRTEREERVGRETGRRCEGEGKRAVGRGREAGEDGERTIIRLYTASVLVMDRRTYGQTDKPCSYSYIFIYHTENTHHYTNDRW